MTSNNYSLGFLYLGLLLSTHIHIYRASYKITPWNDLWMLLIVGWRFCAVINLFIDNYSYILLSVVLVCLSIHQSVLLSVYLSIFLSVYLMLSSVCLLLISFCLSIYPSIHPSIYLCVCLSMCPILYPIRQSYCLSYSLPLQYLLTKIQYYIGLYKECFRLKMIHQCLNQGIKPSVHILDEPAQESRNIICNRWTEKWISINIKYHRINLYFVSWDSISEIALLKMNAVTLEFNIVRSWQFFAKEANTNSAQKICSWWNEKNEGETKNNRGISRGWYDSEIDDERF